MKKRSQELVAEIGEGIVQTDRDQKIVSINSSMCVMLGYPSETLLGSDLASLVVDEALVSIPKLLSERRFQLAWKKRDGTLLLTRTSSHPLVDDDGAVLGVLMVVTDLTEIEAKNDPRVVDACTKLFHQFSFE